jgi:hypothetical protein
MKIHNPNKLPTIDYREVQPLQGNLKELTNENYMKLKKVLETRGFTTPLFIWWFEDTPYLVDGHQRQRVMMEEKLNDAGNFEVPYLRIEATDIKDAKQQVLEVSSQYGTITQEGFDEFIAIDELSEEDIVEVVNFDGLPYLGVEVEKKARNRKLLTCPECQFEGEEKDFKKRYESKGVFHEPEIADSQD